MGFTSPYKQHNYMGEFVNDAGALTFIQAVEWDSNSDGTGNPQKGMTYFNTTSNVLMVYNGTAWVATGASGSAVSSVFGRTGAVVAQSGDYEDGEITAAASATNYTPTGSTVEGHLAGIDTAIGTRAADADVIKKDGSVAFTGDQSLGGNKITNLGAPTAGTDAASKSYVDGVASGLDVKESVRAATTTDLNSNSSISGASASYNNTGGASGTGQITATLAVSGTFTVDTVDLATGDRVLIKDESGGLGADAQGIYSVTISGTSLTLDRATDFDTDAEVTAGAFTFVEEGFANGDSGWVLITNDPIVVGTGSGSYLDFAQFSGAGQVDAGAGLTKTGNQLNVGDANKGVQVNADNLQIDASEIAGNGLQQTAGGGNEHLLAIKPDATTGATVAPLAVGVNGAGVTVDNSTIEHSAGTVRVKDGGVTEAKLSFNAVAVLTGSGNPNSGTGTSGNQGDMYIDTTNDIRYINYDGGATSWQVI